MIKENKVYEFNEEECGQNVQNKVQFINELVGLISICSNKIIELNQNDKAVEFGIDEMIITSYDIELVEKVKNKIKKMGYFRF